MTGNEVKNLRKRSGLTWPEFSKSVGLSNNTLWRIEAGKTTAKGASLKKLQAFKESLPGKQEPGTIEPEVPQRKRKARFSAVPVVDKNLTPVANGKTYKIVILDASSSQQIISVDTQDRALIMDLIERTI